MNHSCNALTCGQRGHWHSCGQCGCQQHAGCGCSACSACGSVASDGTPACNPWAPWGRISGNGCGQCAGCSHWHNGTCGTVCGNNWDAPCSTCGNAPCTCSGCAGGVSGGCLVPRIISTGRTFQRRITQTLCVNDLPDHAESPLTLVGVTVSGPATWEQISECRQTLLRVTVPVAVQIRDCAGRCRTGHSTVTLTIPLCMNCPAQDFWRGQLYVAPCIRLAAPVTEDEDGCFDAALEVQAEVFLLRMQVIDC